MFIIDGNELTMDEYKLPIPLGTLAAPTVAALVKLIEQEAEAWKFLTSFDSAQIFFSVQFPEMVGILRSMGNYWLQIVDDLHDYEDLEDEKLEFLKSKKPFNGAPPHSASIEGATIISLWRNGDQSAALKLTFGFALEYIPPGIRPQSQTLGNNDGILAFVSQTAFQTLHALTLSGNEDARINNSVALVNAAESLASDASNSIKEIKEERVKLNIKINTQRKNADIRYKRVFQLSVKRVRRRMANLKTEFENRQKTFDTLEEVYNTRLMLQNPARLWKFRGESHKQKATYAGYFFFGGSILFALVLANTVYFGGDSIARSFIRTDCLLANIYGCGGISPKGPLVTGVIFFISTLAIWFLRLQMKIFLSERHLAISATERRLFVGTYLGLIKKSKLTGDHETIVLNSLFRPAQDGIINDDGIAGFGLHDFAAKIFEGRKS